MDHLVFSSDDSFHMVRARGSCPGEKPAVGRVCRLYYGVMTARPGSHFSGEQTSEQTTSVLSVTIVLSNEW